MSEEVHAEPAKIAVESGVVRETKPDGAEVAMTPVAAAKTAVDLLEAASKADGLQKLDAERERRKDAAGDRS